MGITGLLPYLEKASKPCHISEFRGATVAVDTYCWLHKGANACAFQLASGEDTQGLVNYCVKYIKLLQSFDIKPILVFDGKNLPAKSETEAKRRESRNQAKQRATELIKLGKTDEARSYLKQSINITPDMASSVIKECHKLNIDCIVAPYESDAQLAFFNLKGVAELVITEDSDLLLFGCSKAFYKLDHRGCGYLVEAEKIPLSMKIRPDCYTFDKFRHMCILSGCDYTESLQGIGLKKAEKFIKLTEETNPLLFLDKLPRYLNMRHLNVTVKYKENFMVADATFRHQTVFDPFQKKLVPLTDPIVRGTDPNYCKNAGDMFDNEKAYQIALGNLHPSNCKELDCWSPSKNNIPRNSIWSGVCQMSLSRKKRKQQLLMAKKTVEKTEVVDTDDEETQSESDKKLDQEILSYFKKPEKRKIEDDIEDKIEEKKERISPILNKNPFVKKLSKFQVTNLDSGLVVRSRFFHSEKKKEEQENDIKEEDCIETFEDSPSSNIENNNNNSNLLDSSTEALARVSLTESDSPTVEITDKTEKENYRSLSQPSSSQAIKRKRTGPCKSVGLKKSKSDNQQTLHNFFNKFKKI